MVGSNPILRYIINLRRFNVMNEFKYAVFKMSQNRPITTLFMLMSVDGKISTGSSDDRDFDSDLLLFNETSDGLQQYYNIEQTTDEWTLCTGKTQAKIGVNNSGFKYNKVGASIVVIDNNHLTEAGVRNLLGKYLEVVLFTTNRNHPARHVESSHLSMHVFLELSAEKILSTMSSEHGCNRITIQSGCYTNSEFVRAHLIDFVDIVVAPVIVGGVRTPSLVGGESFTTVDDLKDLAFLELDKCDVLNNNYVRLRYKVINK